MHCTAQRTWRLTVASFCEVSVTSSPQIDALPIGYISSFASSSFHEQLLDRLHDGVYFVDRERRIQYWNKGAELLTGYSSSEVVGKYCFDNLLLHVDGAGRALCLEGCPLAATIQDGECREAEIFLRHKLGHRLPVSLRAAPIMDANGLIIGAVEIFSDVTVKRNIERRVGELENIAFLDPLTGVKSRRYIELKVKQAIEETSQFNRAAGLLMIDVDHFKRVNDTYGHQVGDSVLRAICQTINANLRLGDILGRWGGEEFLLIVRDVNRASLAAVAEKCRMLVAASAIPVRGQHLRVTISVGATLMAADDSDQSVINRTDELMYFSKSSGRNRVTLG